MTTRRPLLMAVVALAAVAAGCVTPEPAPLPPAPAVRPPAPAARCGLDWGTVAASFGAWRIVRVDEVDADRDGRPDHVLTIRESPDGRERVMVASEVRVLAPRVVYCLLLRDFDVLEQVGVNPIKPL